MTYGITWMVSQALIPATIAKAIDEGIVAGDRAALWRWAGALACLAAVIATTGILRHRMAVLNWLVASFRAIQLIGWKAADTGPALPRTVPTGDVVATVANDAMRFGGFYDVTARFSGAVVSYVVVAVLLLRASLELGLVVLLGVPLLVATLGLVVRPLQRRQTAQREESGRLIGLGADTVAGLRVLRGIGGEQEFLQRYAVQSRSVRDSGFRVAGFQATLDAAQVLLPGLFVIVVTWLGARFAIDGRITPGQLVAFYGYSAFLVLPLRTATEFVDRATKAHIGARKILNVLAVQPDHADVTPRRPVDSVEREPAPAEGPATVSNGDVSLALVETSSGLTLPNGALVALVSAFETVRLHGIPLLSCSLREVRSRVLVSETDPRLFTGTLRSELDPWGTHTDAQILTALDVASGADILDALPDGLDSEVEERGRSLSGGQRQRLTLTRALLADAEILILVEPTSAVDAHTEARIAGRLAEYRCGRTTLVVSASPLMLAAADDVAFLHDGVVTARGRHHDLLRSDPAYRAVVVRGEDS